MLYRGDIIYRLLSILIILILTLNPIVTYANFDSGISNSNDIYSIDPGSFFEDGQPRSRVPSYDLLQGYNMRGSNKETQFIEYKMALILKTLGISISDIENKYITENNFIHLMNYLLSMNNITMNGLYRKTFYKYDGKSETLFTIDDYLKMCHYIEDLDSNRNIPNFIIIDKEAPSNLGKLEFPYESQRTYKLLEKYPYQQIVGIIDDTFHIDDTNIEKLQNINLHYVLLEYTGFLNNMNICYEYNRDTGIYRDTFFIILKRPDSTYNKFNRYSIGSKVSFDVGNSFVALGKDFNNYNNVQSGIHSALDGLDNKVYYRGPHEVQPYEYQYYIFKPVKMSYQYDYIDRVLKYKTPVDSILYNSPFYQIYDYRSSYDNELIMIDYDKISFKVDMYESLNKFSYFHHEPVELKFNNKTIKTNIKFYKVKDSKKNNSDVKVDDTNLNKPEGYFIYTPDYLNGNLHQVGMSRAIREGYYNTKYKSSVSLSPINFLYSYKSLTAGLPISKPTPQYQIQQSQKAETFTYGSTLKTNIKVTGESSGQVTLEFNLGDKKLDITKQVPINQLIPLDIDVSKEFSNTPEIKDLVITIKGG